jgi:TrmH family RNA methyltransferase
MERIASRQNPLVRRFRALATDGRQSTGVLLDGAYLLDEALRSRVPIEVVAVAERHAPEHRILLDAAQRAGARIVQTADTVLDAMSPVRQPSGVVAIASLKPASLEACLSSKPALLVVLAGVQDAGNVGAVIRAAEGCGATGVICTETTADPLGWKALRGAMGSSFRMAVAVERALATVVARLRDAGVTVLATVPRGGSPLGATDLRRPVAVLLGAEGSGLSADAAAAADAEVTIPMRPPVESLNVAIAAALVLFEASRQRESR